MTTEEKLKHFLDVTTESTNAKNAKVLEDYTNALEKAFEEHKEESTRKAALQLKLSEDSFKKETERGNCQSTAADPGKSERAFGRTEGEAFYGGKG